jgi:hypothetical protein
MIDLQMVNEKACSFALSGLFFELLLKIHSQ